MAGFLPAFPIILPKLGMTDAADIGIWTGLLTAAAPFAAAISGPIWGAIGDRVGRKIMVLRALTGLAVFVGLMAFVRDPWILLFLRIGQGIFSGFIAPSLTLVSVHSPSDRQGFVAALLQAALLAGGVAGPPLGGWLLDGGEPSRLFFIASGSAAVSVLLVSIFAREESRPAMPARPTSPISALAHAWTDVRATMSEPVVLKLLIALFAIRFGVSCVDPLFAIYVKTFAHDSSFITNHLAFVNGALVAATPLGTLLALPAWGRAGDRRGYRRALALAAGGAGLFYAPQAFAPETISLFLIRFCAGAFMAGVVPAAYGMVAEETPVTRRGSSYSLTFSSIALANSIGPVIGGECIAAGVTVRPLLLASSVPMILAAIWVAKWKRTGQISK